MNSATTTSLSEAISILTLMTRRAWPAALLAVAAIVSFSLLTGAAGRPITVDDLMKLRSVNDVRISPAGDRVAYVASVPSLPKNEHEAALFVAPANGGTPVRLGEAVRIFNTPTPRPQLRWRPTALRSPSRPRGT